MTASVPTSGFTPLQELVAVVFPLVFWAVFLIVVRHLRFSGLGAERSRDVSRIREQLSSFNPFTLEIADRDADKLDTYRPRLHDLAHGDYTPAQTPRESLANITNAWRERTSPVARLALVMAGEAITIIALTLVVLLPTAVVRDLLDTGDTPTWASVIAAAESTYTFVVDALFLFPATNLFWALGLSAVIQLYDWLYTHGFEIAILLAMGAIAVNVLDSKTDSRLAPRLYPQRLATMRQVGAWALLVWVTGVVPNAALEALGYATAGSLLGSGAATLVAAYALFRAARSIRHRLHSTVGEITNSELPANPGDTAIETDRRLALLYLAVRKAGAGLGVVMLPLIPIYVVDAIASGALVAKADAVGSAPLLVQAALVFVTLAALSWIVTQDAEDWQHVLRAARSALSRHAVRAYLFARLGTAIIFTGVFIMAAILQVPLPLALAAGVVAALTGSVLWKAWQRASFRLHTRDSDPPTPTYLTIAIGTIDTPDGDVYVARIGKQRLAWPELSPLVDELLTIADERFTTGNYPESVMAAYYDDLRTSAETDPELVLQSQRYLAQSATDDLVSREASIDHVHEELSAEFDDRIWQVALEDLESDGRLSREGGRYRWHGPPIGDTHGGF